MSRLSEHFTTEEFECRDRCGFGSSPGDVSPELIVKLEGIRARIGPVRISSGCRCILHNDAIGGTKTSSHTRGEAADIVCPSSADAYAIVKAALEVGFKRIGLERGCVHVDVSSTLPWPVLFTYERLEHIKT